jgi:hypothetical protein
MFSLARITLVKFSDLHRALKIARGAVRAMLATLPPSHPLVTNAQEFVRQGEILLARQST